MINSGGERRGVTFVRLVVAALLAFPLACGGGGGGSTPSAPNPITAPATPPPDYSGNWEGAVRYAGQQLPMAITVGGQQVATLTVDLWVTMGGSLGQRSVTCKYSFSAKSPATIAGSSFEVPVETTNGIVYGTTVHGTFSSPVAASGTIDSFTVNAGICGGQLMFGSPGWSQSPPRWEAVKK